VAPVLFDQLAQVAEQGEQPLLAALGRLLAVFQVRSVDSADSSLGPALATITCGCFGRTWRWNSGRL